MKIMKILDPWLTYLISPVSVQTAFDAYRSRRQSARFPQYALIR